MPSYLFFSEKLFYKALGVRGLLCNLLILGLQFDTYKISDIIYVPFQKKTSLVYFRTDMFVKMYDQIVFTDDLYECHAFHIYWCKHMYMTIGGYDV